VATGLAQHMLDSCGGARGQLLHIFCRRLGQPQELQLAALLVAQIHAIERDGVRHALRRVCTRDRSAHERAR
jgi:hypothetical protein